ncbi:MAG: hypothetical protein JSS31_03855 [Proteobacteria bacterium]|nr:hypothetical protein [Pseudomonadota bacterium]MBS0493082.1 hypothetical protein [Pseudomonadota bacterium]
MRRALSFVLVMLLVLRGLLGDAMAMGVAPTAAAAEMTQLASAAGHGAHASQATAHDCCDAVADQHPAHPACSACGACHSVLGVPAWISAGADMPRAAPRPPHQAPFASAAVAQDIKPPIA